MKFRNIEFDYNTLGFWTNKLLLSFFLGFFFNKVRLKYLSSTSSGILTLEISNLVLVAITWPWCTRLIGMAFKINGPVIKSKPVSSVFNKTARLPLWTPVNKITIVPGVNDERVLRLWFLNKPRDLCFFGL